MKRFKNFDNENKTSTPDDASKDAFKRDIFNSTPYSPPPVKNTTKSNDFFGNNGTRVDTKTPTAITPKKDTTFVGSRHGDDGVDSVPEPNVTSDTKLTGKDAGAPGRVKPQNVSSKSSSNLDDLKGFVKDVTGIKGKDVRDAADTVTNGVKNAASAVDGALSSASDGIKDGAAKSWDYIKSKIYGN